MFCSKQQPIVVCNETLDRWWKPKIRLTTVSRDHMVYPEQHFLSCINGVCLLLVALVVDVPSNTQQWALPIITHFTPSSPLSKQLEQRHKTMHEQVGQLATVVRCWYANRTIIFVDDGVSHVFAPLSSRSSRQEGCSGIVGQHLPTGEPLLANEEVRTHMRNEIMQ